MNLDTSPADQAFRVTVRRFFAEDFPRKVLDTTARGQLLTRGDHVASQRAFQSRGWLAAGWPVEHGGPDWSPTQKNIFADERELAGAPPPIPMSIIYIGPIISALGTPEQQQKWLPDILAVNSLWCQGYSEPDAGSDLASLSFSATRDGDDYLLNGTKIWTTEAHWADWIFCLARTSVELRRQDGISMICAPMDSPGITVYPILSIDGTHDFNRVQFVDVRVPAAYRLGEEGAAWNFANLLLKNERLSYVHVARKRQDLVKVRRMAAATPASAWGRERRSDSQLPLMIDDPAFLLRLAEVEIELEALEMMYLRAQTAEVEMGLVSTLKIVATESSQHITELFLELAGRNRAPELDRQSPDWASGAPLVPAAAMSGAHQYLTERNATLYGGTTQVQKTIIWRMIDKGPA